MMKLPKQRPKTKVILRLGSDHDITNTTITAIGIPTNTNGLKEGDLTLLLTYIISQNNKFMAEERYSFFTIP